MIFVQMYYARCFAREQQAIVDEGHSKRSMTYIDTIDFVQAIYDMIKQAIIKVAALDHFIAKITRLILYFDEVTLFRRTRTVELPVSVSCFY